MADLHILIAIKGTEDAEWVRRMAALAPLASAEAIYLGHVIDARAREGLERGRERYLGRRPLGERRLAAAEEAEGQAASAALGFARQILESLGVEGDRFREVILRGKPNEMLRDLAEDERIDLIVVGGRPGNPGPHSLGKTARFLVDHAPVAALLVR